MFTTELLSRSRELLSADAPRSRSSFSSGAFQTKAYQNQKTESLHLGLRPPNNGRSVGMTACINWDMNFRIIEACMLSPVNLFRGVSVTSCEVDATIPTEPEARFNGLVVQSSYGYTILHFGFVRLENSEWMVKPENIDIRKEGLESDVMAQIDAIVASQLEAIIDS